MKRQRQPMMHGDEGIGVDGLKEHEPGPYTHENFLVYDIMEHDPSPIHMSQLFSLDFSRKFSRKY
jgi:hypothetical protein